MPVRLVNAEGVPVIEFLTDCDGGHIHIKDLYGKLRVTIGCHARGGFLDIIHAGTEALAITLTANEDGGSIEYTNEGECYSVTGERYWPPPEEAR